jgi:hypothetical protein
MSTIRTLIEKANAEEQRRMIEDSRFIEEQKIRKALGPRKWEELKKEIKQDCEYVAESSPAKMSFESVNANEGELRNLRNGSLLSLSYNGDVPCIFYEGIRASGEITFRVECDGSLTFMAYGIPRGTEEVVTVLMRQV